jgi:hypothetical protein
MMECANFTGFSWGIRSLAGLRRGSARDH